VAGAPLVVLTYVEDHETLGPLGRDGRHVDLRDRLAHTP
jgi:hypothetical protein